MEEKTKLPAAVALGKRRWKGKTAEEKRAHTSMMGKKNWERMTEKEKSERSKKMNDARWGKNEKPASS